MDGELPRAFLQYQLRVRRLMPAPIAGELLCSWKFPPLPGDARLTNFGSEVMVLLAR